MESGDRKSAAGLLKKLDGYFSRGTDELVLSMLFRAADDPAAAKWEKKALKRIMRANYSAGCFKEMMKGEMPITRENIDNVAALPMEKAVYLTALAQKFPEHKKLLLSEADRLNVSPEFPSRLLRSIGR